MSYEEDRAILVSMHEEYVKKAGDLASELSRSKQVGGLSQGTAKRLRAERKQAVAYANAVFNAIQGIDRFEVWVKEFEEQQKSRNAGPTLASS